MGVDLLLAFGESLLGLCDGVGAGDERPPGPDALSCSDAPLCTVARCFPMRGKCAMLAAGAVARPRSSFVIREIGAYEACAREGVTYSCANASMRAPVGGVN